MRLPRTRSQKIIPYAELGAWRNGLASCDLPLVATNGCFDLLHPGHVDILETARSLGKTLIVGVTSDCHVRHLKGPGRPVNAQDDRVAMLAALESVCFVTLFPELDATGFLGTCQPDIYIKGGDYSIDSINAEEKALLQAMHVDIRFLPFRSGWSTSNLMQAIRDRS